MIKLYFFKKEKAYIYSEIFARTILGKVLVVDGNTLSICTNEFGKPYLKDYPSIHYNISHTKDILVCVISDKPIGVDIEKKRPIKVKIIKHVFTLNEQKYIWSNKKELDEIFTELWTRKEAYVKWLGKGMEIPFNSFDVLDETRLITLKINDYIISICTNSLEK